MLTFGSCINFVLPVDVSSLAKISADAFARWVTLAAVEKVGMVPCHTFQDCCCTRGYIKAHTIMNANKALVCIFYFVTNDSTEIKLLVL